MITVIIRKTDSYKTDWKTSFQHNLLLIVQLVLFLTPAYPIDYPEMIKQTCYVTFKIYSGANNLIPC